MSVERKKVIIEVDAKTYSAIEEYSGELEQSEESVVNELVNRSLEEFSMSYANLKQGYVEMGDINLEISDAFTVSENEALDYIDD